MTEEKRFQGIVRNVTLSKEDMTKLLNMPLEEVDEWSPVNVILFDDWEGVVQSMAQSMVDKIRENNKAGKITTFILPVGPTGQYPIAAEMSNKERVSWRNVSSTLSKLSNGFPSMVRPRGSIPGFAPNWHDVPRRKRRGSRRSRAYSKRPRSFFRRRIWKAVVLEPTRF